MRVRPLLLLLGSFALGATSCPLSSPRLPRAPRWRRVSGSKVLRAHLEFLADDALEGRAPGTRGGEAGAEVHRGPVPEARARARGRQRDLLPAGPDHRADAAARRSPSAAPATRAAHLEGRLRALVHAQRGQRQSSTATRCSWATGSWHRRRVERLRGARRKGKIVVVLVNDPGLQDSTLFRGKILTYYGRWTYKIEEARRQGAAGLLLVHTTESATYPWTTVLSGWTGPQVRLEKPPDSLVVAGWLTRSRPRHGCSRPGGQDLAALTAAAAAEGLRARPARHHGWRDRCEARSGAPRPRTSWAGFRARARSPGKRC